MRQPTGRSGGVRTATRSSLTAVLLAIGLLLTGCTSDGDDPTPEAEESDDQATSADATDEAAPAADDTDDTDETDDGGDMAEPDRDAAIESTVGGTATITFDGGDTLSTDVLCVLAPQPAAGGGQILYTATSLSSPYFDLTVFADDAGTVTDSSVSWDETEDFETYAESWSAGGFGSDLTVAREDTTLTAAGTFTRGEDESGQPGETRPGDVLVECG